ncbi:MAG: hypothetical protein IPG89_01005 [Bacteroidetes bacterium]|nr:hypothetical protein [Bacteroidota bacterium]
MKYLKYLFLVSMSMFMLSFIDIPKEEQYYYGELKIKKNFVYYDSSYSMQNFMAHAWMYDDSVNYSQSWKAVNNATIYFNDVSLKYNPIIKTYTDTIQRRTNRGINWTLYNTISGTSSNVNCLDSFPSISNYNILPSNFNRTLDFNIDFSSVAFADEIEISMYDGKFRSTVPYYRKVKANITSITIPASDLSTLDGEFVTVTISLIKKNLNCYKENAISLNGL